MESIIINSPNVHYDDDFIESNYDYHYVKSHKNDDGKIVVTPYVERLIIRTNTRLPRLGVMLVGWGGNNGTTFTATTIANRLGLSWPTRRGTQKSNWYGSITQTSTIRINDELNIRLGNLLPMIEPDNLIIDGWDINSKNLYLAMKEAQVLEPTLQKQLQTHMELLKPRPSIFDSDFIATNQIERADNLIIGTKYQQFQQICQDIHEFRHKNECDQVIILWTANTERFAEIQVGINDTAPNLKNAILNGHEEISPSTIFAYAAIQSGCIYINGSPQNTFVPGIIELAEECGGTFIVGDDFKSGQTKIKSVLVDFLVSAGIKPTSIVSYNHLGNNDGKNLSAPKQFRSKEISKSNVVDDMVKSNPILYKSDEKPDHVVVIKYVPYVGDSKRALDEYTSEISMGGLNTIVIHNTCEDSLLASPIMLDLILLAELCTRIRIKRPNDSDWTQFHTILSILGYLCKAPLVPADTPIINALFRQRACIENVLRACLGLPPDSNMLLEHKIPFLMSAGEYQKKYTSTDLFI